jgi:L-histidine N-alpha-methyltransferase
MNALLTGEGVVVRPYPDPPHERSPADDVLDGLTRPFKELPPTHFYDARGGDLFNRITELPEYYPTRAERAILEDIAGDAVAALGAAELVGLGSGAATKTRVLLQALHDPGTLRRCVPIDVAENLVGATAAFIGVTIGNFPPGSRRRFLRTLARLPRPGVDGLLLGTDLVKDKRTLEAAYNDAAGVTAEFNRNVLRVINRELGADLDIDAFEQVAFYDRDHEWIEMRLRAQRRKDVHVRRARPRTRLRRP